MRLFAMQRSGWFVTPPSGAPSLSAQLRAQTAPLHGQIETLLRLPGAIRTRDDYLVWFGHFIGFYEPLEHALAAFPEWESLGLALPVSSHSSRLADDITAFGTNPGCIPRTSLALLPHLPSFAHALGALYVLEGATLGGRIIRGDLDSWIGAPIAGATRFFGGRGEAVGPMWLCFRAGLDEFGRERPHLSADVVNGGERAFHAMLAWFTPFCTVAAGRP